MDFCAPLLTKIWQNYSGFDILRKLASDSFHTIVVSAYTDRAIEAFEFGVLDFIGKPFAEERVNKALSRYAKGLPSGDQYLKYLAIQNHKGVDFVDLDHISYIKASGIYSELILLDGSVSVYNKPLNQLLKLLPEEFVRTHKSYVTHISYIASIEKRQSNTFDAKLSTGEKIPISRSMRKEIIKRMTANQATV